jgi:hypothetical protein
MRLRFNGPTPHTITLPVPFVSRCMYEGEIVFDPEAECPDESAVNLMTLDARFECVDPPPAPRAAPVVAGPSRTKRPARRKPPRRAKPYAPKNKIVPSPLAEGTPIAEPSPFAEGSEESSNGI